MHGRPTCYRCYRPESHCVCGLVPPFEAHCGLLVLQHPHERRKYYSTARLLLQAVRNAQLLRGVVFPEGDLWAAFQGRRPYLLYPRPDSISCEEAPLAPDALVVVLDGTWSEAGKIFLRNPILQTLPTISFREPLRSNYRIRKQPKAHCLSTIESVAHMLRGNAIGQGRPELAARYGALFSAFDAMVERQIQFFPRSGGVANHRRRGVIRSGGEAELPATRTATPAQS